MKQNTNICEEKDEKIIEVLKFFSTNHKTFNDWLNETNKHQKHSEEELFFNELLLGGFLLFPGIKNVSPYISLFNEYNTERIIVTKDGYSFLNSYKFNKQSLEINKQVLQTSNQVKVISFIALIIAFISLIFSLCK